ncbi:MAG: hypothetical protein ACYC6N_25760 [Pirellulaceae bacterium]
MTVIALVIGIQAASAQSYPYAGASPTVGGYPGMAPQMQPGMGGPMAGMPGQVAPYYPGSPVGGPGGATPYAPAGYAPQAPQGYQPVAYPAPYYDPSQGAAPQQLAPAPPMSMGGPMMGDEAYGQMGPMGCNVCGGYGCEQCMGAADDFDLRLLHWLLPYGAGGCGMQRWYDVSAEWVSLNRDDVGTPTVYTTEGVGGVAVLGTDDLGFDDASGARVSFAIQLGAGNNIEATLLGGFNWASRGEAFSADNQLFSIISDYGQAPFMGFDETDEAQVQRLEYSSELNTVELNYRQRWAGPNVRVQGSWLAGVRYFELVEDLRYLTFAPANPGSMNYLVGTSNALTGAQLGGDLWLCIMPGVQIGSEVKLGIYGNHASQRTVIEASSFVDPLRERVTDNAAAFLGDANVVFLWRVSQNWTFRAGYTFLWVDEVALATENFNAGPPFVEGQRTLFLNNGSDMFYHGATLGLEYLW